MFVLFRSLENPTPPYTPRSQRRWCSAALSLVCLCSSVSFSAVRLQAAGRSAGSVTRRSGSGRGRDRLAQLAGDGGAACADVTLLTRDRPAGCHLRYTHTRTHARTRTLSHTHTHSLSNTHTLSHTHTYTCTHTHSHTRTHARTHTHTLSQIHTLSHTHTHSRARTHIHAHAHTHAHTHTHSQTHTLTHAHTYTCTHTHSRTRTHTRAHTCTHAHSLTHTSTHTHTHTRAHIHAHAHNHVRAHTRAHTRSLAHSHTHTHSHEYAHTHTRTHTHSKISVHATLAWSIHLNYTLLLEFLPKFVLHLKACLTSIHLHQFKAGHLETRLKSHFAVTFFAVCGAEMRHFHLDIIFIHFKGNIPDLMQLKLYLLHLWHDVSYHRQ